MSQFNPDELASHAEKKVKTKNKKENCNTKAKKLPLDTLITHHGEVVSEFSTIAEGIRCDCPDGSLHSDGRGEDYAHTVSLSGGDVGISCSGERCSGLFIPETPTKQSMTSDINHPPKMDIGQLDSVELLHFTEDMIPESIKHWTLDNCMHAEASLNYGAVTSIIICSNLIGMQCQVAPKKNGDWKLTPNLWGVIIGNPSERKSPVVEQFLKPIKRFESKSFEIYKSEMKQYESEKSEIIIAEKVKKKALQEAYEARDKKRIDAARSIDIPSLDEPKMERFIINDATTEKIGELMSGNPRTILQYRDELAGFFAALSKAGREGDRSFYLEAFKGDAAYTSDRIGRGTVHIDNLSIGLFGTIQPEMMEKYIIPREGDSGDGLAQRLQLAVFSDNATRPYYDKPIDTSARDSAYEILEKLAYENYEQLAGAKIDYDGIPYFRFNKEAQDRFEKWYAGTKIKESTESNVNIQAHIGKYYGLLPLLALTFFLIDKIAGVTNATAIEVSHVELSVRWCTVLESHARKMYSLTEGASEATLNQKIISYVKTQQNRLPMTCGELSGNIRGAKAKDVKVALEGIAQIEGNKVIKLLNA